MMTSREQPKSVADLNEWLKGEGRSQTMLAKLIPSPRRKDESIKPQTVSQWARGVSRPDEQQAEILEVVTGGKVTKDGWKLSAEKQALKQALKAARSKAA